MYKRIALKYFSSSNYSFGIIGSGPGGFYTAKHLLKKFGNIKIDIYEKLPHPFGLIRTGVAPDHQVVKNVEKDFSNLIEDERVRFFGNVEVGKDISFETIRKNYSGVVLAYGTDTDNKLNIKNEEAFGCFSARNFINWYNGHILNSMESQFNNYNFSDCKETLVIGNGNVAIDVARILSKSVDELKTYDIPDYVLTKLSHKKLNNIHIIGRRGLMQSAFTIKEMRELSKVEGVKIFVYKDELADCLEDKALEAILPAQRRHISRKIELVKSFNLLEKDQIPEVHSGINIILRFYLVPQEIICNDNKVRKMKFSRNKDNKCNLDNNEFLFNTDLILKSIGYRSVNIFESLKFNEQSGTLHHTNGVNHDILGNLIHNIFCVGWAKTGPKGIVDTTLRDSFDTVESIFKAFENDSIVHKEPDVENIKKEIESKGKLIISKSEWNKINQYEIQEGIKKGKVREKLVDLEKLFSVINI